MPNDTEEAYFRINGSNIVKKIAEFKYSSNDLDGPDAGRTMDTKMHRDKLGDKFKVEIKLVPLYLNVLTNLVASLTNQYVTVETNIVPGMTGAREMYNSTRSGGLALVDTDHRVLYRDVSFNLIER